MPSLFLGIYTALYAYEARSDQEVSMAAGDLLYLLEKSSEDDWWTVKKRVSGMASEEPSGLVPNNYVDKAPIVDHAKALYDYDRQTEEELSFSEGVQFDVYDKSDQDWILVGQTGSDQYGFVPANYIQYDSQHGPVSAPVVQNTHASGYNYNQQPADSPTNRDKPLPNFPPPPASHLSSNSRDAHSEDAPPMPARPGGGGATADRKSSDDRQATNSSSNSRFFTWSVQEVDGRKKSKATLAIGNGQIMYTPDRSGSEPQQWEVQDLTSYSQEKKHVFLEFQHPRASLDLHAGSKDNAEDIVGALGEIAGASRATGLREVLVAAQSAGQKMGKVLYDFEAQGDDEVSAKENENVFILDDKKSKEWWMVRTSSGEEGVMPSSYIDIFAEASDSSKRLSLPFGKKKNNSFSSSSGGAFGRSASKRLSRRMSTKEVPERETKNRPRDEKTRGHATRSKPDMAKVRTWTDRSNTFKVEAELLGCADGKIHLHKLNGVQIAVAASKMSMEDLEYVERVTGARLDDDKPLVDLRRNGSSRQREHSRGPVNGSPLNSGVPGGVSTGVSKTATKSASATSLTSATENHNQSNGKSNKPDYDWFGFFLECGVDVNNCQRYAMNFSRDQMDDTILPDINAAVLRNLGLKEGDILRVTKKLDDKYKRSRADSGNAQGGLFSAPGGVLLNNTNRPAAAGASASSSSLPNQQQNGDSGISSTTSLPRGRQGFDDDAWAIKGEPSQPQAPPAQPQRPVVAPQQQVAPAAAAPTGTMRDLMSIQPLQPEKTAQSIIADQQLRQQQFQAQQNTQKQIEMLQQQQAQQQQTITKLQAQNTQNQFQQQQLVAQLTGGNPFNNPLGTQITGGGQPIVASLTGQSALGPLATGNSMPLSMNNGFVQQPVVNQLTGGYVQPQASQLTGGYFQQAVGNQLTGGFVQQPVGSQVTGDFVQQPAGFQATNGFTGQPTGVFTTGNNPFMAIQQPTQNQPANFSSQSLNSLTQQFQQTGMGAQPSFSQPPATSFSQSVPNFNMQYFNQPQTQQQTFSQPNQQNLQPQSTGFGFGNSSSTFGGSSFGDSPGANSFGAFPGTAASQLGQIQPLQAQQTGPHPPVSFGGPQPLLPTATGNRRANLATATANNPFGF